MAYQSMITLALLAFDRHQSLVNALVYKQFVTRRKYVSFCLFSWIYSGAVALPPVFGLGKYIYEQPYFGCHFDWYGVHSKYSKSFKMAQGALIYLPTLVIIPACYSITFVKVRKHLLLNRTIIPNYHDPKVRKLRRGIKMAKAFLYATIVYVISTFPFVTGRIVESYIPFQLQSLLFLNQMTLTMFTCPHFINPILYFFGNKRLRSELCSILTKFLNFMK